MSTWYDREDCLERLEYYKKFYKDEADAISKAADSMDISEDKFMEMIDESDEDNETDDEY